MRKVKGLEVLDQPTLNRGLTEQDLAYIYNPKEKMPDGFIERLTQWSKKIKELYEENK